MSHATVGAVGDTVTPEDAEALNWELPGHGSLEHHAKCGEWRILGHAVSADPKDLTHIYAYHWWRARYACHAFDCPVDLSSSGRWANGWSMREACEMRADLGRTSVHVVVSAPGPQGGPALAPLDHTEYVRMRTSAYRALRAAYPGRQLVAALVFHPLRCVGQDRNQEDAHEGAHWHALLRRPGRYDGTAVSRHHARTGWVVKVLGPRLTARVAIYELHHAGRLSCPTSDSASGHRYLTLAVTWLGLDREGRERIKEAREGHPECPICGQALLAGDVYLLVLLGGPPASLEPCLGDLNRQRTRSWGGECHAEDIDWSQSRKLGWSIERDE